MKMQLSINENLYEDKTHGNFPFPFEIGIVDLSSFDQGFMACHWHPELEFTIVLEGAVEYQVNETIYRLSKGDGLFVNANSLHTARAYKDSPGIFMVFVFNPVLIYGYEGSAVKTKYMDPFLDSPNLVSLNLDTTIPWHAALLSTLTDIAQIHQCAADGFELEITQNLTQIWHMLYEGAKPLLMTNPAHNVREMSRLKEIIAYIHAHYDEKLTLTDMAAVGNVSTGECCRFFKRLIRQTPFEYLLRYRVNQSLLLLQNPHLSITDIATHIGFSNGSYYTEIFKRVMHISPSAYRKQI